MRKAYPDRQIPNYLLVGKRGYYLNSMGDKGRNDRKVYDDAIFLLTPNVFAGFNANVDPSAWRQDIATLQPGWYESYQFDTHNGSAPHPAICQRAGTVIVYRDGTQNVKAGTEDKRGVCLGKGLWVGMFGINIHRGGKNGTSSLGCQTVPPNQWDAFYALAKGEAVRLFGTRWSRVTIPYCLIG
jgi:lysozyme